jgi:GNAT superfamily N-acetyltransferase
MLSELVVHPVHQRRGVGRAPMQAIEAAFPMAPVHVNALGISRAFYEALGYRTASTPVTALFKKPGQAANVKPSSEQNGSSHQSDLAPNRQGF